MPAGSRHNASSSVTAETPRSRMAPTSSPKAGSSPSPIYRQPPLPLEASRSFKGRVLSQGPQITVDDIDRARDVLRDRAVDAYDVEVPGGALLLLLDLARAGGRRRCRVRLRGWPRLDPRLTGTVAGGNGGRSSSGMGSGRWDPACLGLVR